MFEKQKFELCMIGGETALKYSSRSSPRWFKMWEMSILFNYELRITNYGVSFKKEGEFNQRIFCPRLASSPTIFVFIRLARTPTLDRIMNNEKLICSH